MSKTFERIKNEMAIAGWGDWNIGEKLTLADISKFVIQHKYTFIETFIINGQILSLHQLNKSFILGFLNQETEKFKVLFEIEFSIINLCGLKLHNVDGVRVDGNFHGRGISKVMYRYFVKTLNYNIIGDTIQYFGARKLWTSLSKDTDIKVDILNFNTGRFIDKNVILYHGSDDWDFDSRVLY